MKTATFFARMLRKNQTESEKILWSALRNRQLNGIKFLRQRPIYTKKTQSESKLFIVDFYCHQYKLVIEIDGGYHEQIKGADVERDEILNIYAYNVLRFTNKEIKTNLEDVLNRILIRISELEKEKDLL